MINLGFVKCKCGSTYFEDQNTVKLKMQKMASGTVPYLVPIKVFKCLECNSKLIEGNGDSDDDVYEIL